MKMIMAIVQSKDAGKLRDAFIDNNIGATKLSSTGGFLREGNTTYMVVVEDDRVDEVLEIIKHNAKSREQYMTPAAQIDNGSSAIPINVQIGGATVFILPVEKFLQF